MRTHDRATVALLTTVASWFDFQTELVIVFGRKCRDVTEADALAYVAGYAIGKNISARDLQTATPLLTAAKISDGFAPIGP